MKFSRLRNGTLSRRTHPRYDHKPPLTRLSATLHRLRAADGVLDLASVMVGVIILGILSTTIAATVFAVIPWSQDQAARSNLQSVATAQASERVLSLSYFSYDSMNPTPTPSGQIGIVPPAADRLLIDATDTGYLAASRSQSGHVFFASNTKTSVAEGTWTGLPNGYSIERAEVLAAAVRTDEEFVVSAK